MISIVVALALAGTAASTPCNDATLGAHVTNISVAMRRDRHIPDYVAGAFVRRVRAQTPAARAEMRAGDIVQAIDRDLIQSACDFDTGIAKHGCTDVKLTVYRNGETVRVDTRAVDESSLPQTATVNDQQACLDGDGSACRVLAIEHGEAVDLLRQSCDLGDAEGCYILGLKLRDPKEQFKAYEQGCDGGYSQSCNNLAWMYEYGSGVNKDLAASVRLYKRACDGTPCSLPNNLGCVNLGRAFHAGRGTEKNFVISTKLFRDVCRRTPVAGSDEDAATITRACALAGTALVFGEGVPLNMKEGLLLLEQACSADDTFGCFNLGAIYESGEGVPPDRVRALLYYQRACDHGDTEACGRMADLKK